MPAKLADLPWVSTHKDLVSTDLALPLHSITLHGFETDPTDYIFCHSEIGNGIGPFEFQVFLRMDKNPFWAKIRIRNPIL